MIAIKGGKDTKDVTDTRQGNESREGDEKAQGEDAWPRVDGVGDAGSNGSGGTIHHGRC